MKLNILTAVAVSIIFFNGCGTENNNFETTENTVLNTSEVDSTNVVDKFNNAVEAFFNSESFTISANTIMNISDETSSKSAAVEMTTDIKAKNDSIKNKIAEFKTVFNINDNSKEESSGYFKDGFFYNSQKQKFKIDFTEVLTEGNINIFKLTDKVIVSEPKVEKVDDGNRIRFDLNVAVLQQEIPDFIPNLTTYLRVSEYDFIMSRCQIDALIGNDGNLKFCGFIIKAKDTLYDGTSDKDFKSFIVDCNIEVNIDILNLDNTDFDIPDDLESYTDITPETETTSQN